MKKIIKYGTFAGLIIFLVVFGILIYHVFSPINKIQENIGLIKDVIIPLVCAYIPVIITYYYDDKIDNDNLKRSLDILERHWQNNCIDQEGNKIADGTTTSGFSDEYDFIVTNWNKSTDEILKLAKKQAFLKGKKEGPEIRAKNHFLGKKF